MNPKKGATGVSDLCQLAKRYVWWQKPEWAYRHPTVFFGNVMNLGTWDDILLLLQLIPPEQLKNVLKSNPAGLFSQRSWDYWHLKLGYPFGQIPPLPKRDFS